ncbi:MAG: PadR family transcriptional regulator [Acidobacteriia bacterium]|nr:PadR family transcriptional regulator [Terriglobia bacterium]
MAATGRGDLLPGTLEMLILVTLRREPLHGYAIAQRIQQNSGDLLHVEEGSLYPALQRMLIEGWVSAEWGMSPRNRRARIYTLTPAGRKQLSRETRRVGRLIDGIVRLLRPSEA